MNKDQLLSVVRFVLTTFGTTAVTRGYLDGASMEAIVGGVVALTALLWSLWHHKNSTEVRIIQSDKGTKTLLLLMLLSPVLVGCTSTGNVKAPPIQTWPSHAGTPFHTTAVTEYLKTNL